MDLAAPLGRQLSPETAVPVAVMPQDGNPVAIERHFDPVAAASERAFKLLRKHGERRSVAVIVPSTPRGRDAKDWAGEVRGALQHFHTGPKPPGATVSVLTGREARGLEFDHVVVVEPQSFIPASHSGEQELYIALTRSTQTLTVLHRNDLPSVLRSEALANESDRLARASAEGRCLRFHRNGVRCGNPSVHPDGWCRVSGCEGFTRATPPPRSNRRLRPLEKDGPLADFELSDLPEPPAKVRVTGGARAQYVKHHGGSTATAQAALRGVATEIMQHGRVHRLPGRCCIAEHQGFRLVLNAVAWEVLGYDTKSPDLTYEQFAAGVRPRQSDALPARQPEAPKGVAEEEPLMQNKHVVDWSSMTAEEFAAMQIAERIQAERDDPDHEILRSQMYLDLQRRRKADGGKAGQEDGVDAWYELDGVTTVFEVLELGGFDYQKFRRGAVDLLEVAYMYCQGGKAIKVLVSQQPPDEPWTTKALKNIFDVFLAWPEDGTWSGPGAEHIRPEI
ncbi:hypothetical protein [Glycomyces tritici]|uniref:(+)RNA virus helicase C-terminal domain-containing protein n=1 Tax=Glycomyces tritici TaxID=2665176 RepID=A0ABT7YXP0_9ACTN|nr:hypothetical protein [Glycomyces tritici]MDN3243417.1 hypothetical protein [Glycomyces tritici]